jgi:hypothetical protein
MVGIDVARDGHRHMDAHGLTLLIQARGVASWPLVTVSLHGPNDARADAGRVGEPSLRVDGPVLGVLP